MVRKNFFIFGLIMMLFMFAWPIDQIKASEKASKSGSIELPSSVINIEKENTTPSQVEDKPQLKPSEFTKELLETSNEPIENPYLIHILNESSINKSPFSIGTRATIYMGQYPLNYQSQESKPNWEFQKINTNVHDNTSGKENTQLSYVQQAHKRVKGGLTAQVPQAEDVQSMMLLKAIEKTKLPLGTESVIGAGTKYHQVYNVHPKKTGNLHAFVPAVVEKGEITYGEVYIVIKGSKRKIEVKNITSQKIGAWLPIKDHLSLNYQTK